MTALLPAEFAALEPFVPDWAGTDAAVRADLRDNTPFAEMEAFHAAVQPHLADALAYLDDRGLADHDERDQCLMRLLLTFAHVALAVEVQREEEQMHRQLRAPLRIRRAPADMPVVSRS